MKRFMQTDLYQDITSNHLTDRRTISRGQLLLFGCITALIGAMVSSLLMQPGNPTVFSASAQSAGTNQYAPPAYQPPAYQPPVGGGPASMAPSGTMATSAAAYASNVRPDLLPEEKVNNWVYEHANRSVVNIATRSIEPNAFFYSASVSEGEGSGIVIDRQGHILTNCHVVEGAREVQVSLFDGTTYPANIVGQDPSTDVAVLKIEAPSESLQPVTFGDSSQLLVGQNVYAIGNPFALERTLTTGIISSLGRSIPSRHSYRSIKQVIQTDAAVNPGNSGGPLLDSAGRMIGMNTAIASNTGQSAGVSFAVPVNTIARIVPELLKNGRVYRADIGIAQVYQTEQGLLISALVPDGAAEKAGLKGPKLVREQAQVRGGYGVVERVYIDRSVADLIVGLDGKAIESAEEFITQVETREPGERVTVNVIRNGKPVNIQVTLDAGE